MLYDVDKLNQKGEKFIFDYDVNTSSKFWIGRNSPSNIDKKVGRDKELKLRDLQAQLNKEVDENIETKALPFIKLQHGANEMLMGLSTSALKALFSTQDTSRERVRAFLQAVYLSHDYGINVPVLIIDGQSEPKVYTRASLMQDLIDLSQSHSIRDRRVFKELLSCFYSPDEIKDIKNQPEALHKKCAELFKISVFPETNQKLPGALRPAPPLS